jgi:putative membrane protein
MNTWWILRTELRRLFHSRIGRAALIAGMIIPLLYSGLYLYAFWDPYEQMHEYPVALVNLDKGGVKDGKTEHFGDELAKKLVDAKDVKWLQVSGQEAKDGQDHNKYYLTVTIPPTFTEDILSVNSDHPHRAEIGFAVNEGKNYIASTISKRLETSVREKVGNEFSKEFFTNVFDVIGAAGNGLTKAANGAHDLADGAKTLNGKLHEANDGMQKLNDGITKVGGGVNTANDGAQKLAGGSQKVADGNAQVAQKQEELSQGVDKLGSGSAQIAKGANDMANGNQSLADNLTKSTAGVKQVRDGLQGSLSGSDQLQAGLTKMKGTLGSMNGSGGVASSGATDPSQMSTLELLNLLAQKYSANGLQNDPLYQGVLKQVSGVSAGLGETATQVGGSKERLTKAVGALGEVAKGQDQMLAGARQLADGGKQVAAGANALQTGAAKAADGGRQLSAATGQLASGARDVANGNRSLADGTAQLAGGMPQLTDGSGKLAEGLPQLADGSQKVADGNQELSGKLQDALKDSTVKSPDEKADIMSDPVHMAEKSVNPVGTYGMGFASYFIPLSLWVGALMLYFTISLREYRWTLTPVSTTSLVLGKFLTLGIIGVLQAVIVDVVLTEVLGLQVQHLPEFYLFTILYSLTAIAIIGLLIARLGSGAGRFLTIVLLVLQLTSSAGTFPLELVPKLFQSLNPFLPMTYAIDGLRSIISTGDQATAWRDLGMLAAILAGILLVHIFTTRRTLRVSDLHGKDELAG